MPYLGFPELGTPVAVAGDGAHMSYLEAGVVGLIQGVTELFPVSSIGHNVLVPALVGGQWASDLNVGAPESPYLAYIVGLHVATALALLVYFWRDWARIIGGFFTSFGQFARPATGTRRWQLTNRDQRPAWLMVVATVPVGLAGVKYEHEFRVITGHAITAAYFLVANGLILFAGERFRTRRSLAADREQAMEDQQAPAREPAVAGAGRHQPPARHAAGERAFRREQIAQGILADRRISRIGGLSAVVLGATQSLALLAGISRDGIVMVDGMFRGLSRQDPARFSFLLATPAIFGAGALKIGDLIQLGQGIYGPILFGSILSGIGAYVSVRFLIRYFRQARTLYPFAVYCLVVGAGSIAHLTLRYLGVIRRMTYSSMARCAGETRLGRQRPRRTRPQRKKGDHDSVINGEGTGRSTWSARRSAHGRWRAGATEAPDLRQFPARPACRGSSVTPAERHHPT